MLVGQIGVSLEEKDSNLTSFYPQTSFPSPSPSQILANAMKTASSRLAFHRESSAVWFIVRGRVFPWKNQPRRFVTLILLPGQKGQGKVALRSFLIGCLRLMILGRKNKIDPEPVLLESRFQLL